MQQDEISDQPFNAKIFTNRDGLRMLCFGKLECYWYS